MAVLLENNLHINNVKTHLGLSLCRSTVQLTANERNQGQFVKRETAPHSARWQAAFTSPSKLEEQGLLSPAFRSEFMWREVSNVVMVSRPYVGLTNDSPMYQGVGGTRHNVYPPYEAGLTQKAEDISYGAMARHQ